MVRRPVGFSIFISGLLAMNPVRAEEPPESPLTPHASLDSNAPDETFVSDPADIPMLNNFVRKKNLFDRFTGPLSQFCSPAMLLTVPVLWHSSKSTQRGLKGVVENLNLKQRSKKVAHDYKAMKNRCLDFIHDYFEIASPYCPERKEVSKIASGCTMLDDYLVAELSGPRAAEYTQAIKNAAKALNLAPPGLSSYEVILKAVNGNRDMAIFILSLSTSSAGGLKALSNKLRGANKSLVASLDDLEATQNSSGYLKRPEAPSPYSSLDKSYHFWPRALLASRLKEKGYPKNLVKLSTIFSQAFYEYGPDAIEHLLRDKLSILETLKSANKDVGLAKDAVEFVYSDHN